MFQSIKRAIESFANPLSVAEVNRLAGLCEGILADDTITYNEAAYLASWISRSPKHLEDPRSRPIVDAVGRVLFDDRLNPEEADELRVVLSDFCDRVLDDEAPLRKTVKAPIPQADARAAKTAVAVPSHASRPRAGEIFEISYMDASGNLTARSINFRSCSTKNGAMYLNAFCLTRNAFRTFRVDRILSATHTGTGEWINDPECYFAL